MIYFDTTNASRWSHGSGLSRVSRRLSEGLGDAATFVRWPHLPHAGPSDWFLTPELFAEEDRPGLSAFLERHPCRLAAVYHDAIPLKLPEITWPASVRRHASYMRMLADFDRVWAVSAASREELLSFWRWQHVEAPPPVEVLLLGADGLGAPRGSSAWPERARIVSVGILEPRKNQAVLLDAFEALQDEGSACELHLAGRVNPHFGKPIRQRIERLRGRFQGLVHHADMGDGALAALVRSATATAFASLAEGCGLPVLESLWLGVPCLCSDLAPLLETAAAGGCDVVPGNTVEGWVGALRRILTDRNHRDQLAGKAAARALPTWACACEALRTALG